MQQTAVFFNQNPGEAHLTLEELRNMAIEKKSQLFMTKVSRYVANVTGSSAYWYKLQQDLKAIISYKGPPTIFLHCLQQICIGQNCISSLAQMLMNLLLKKEE